MRLFPSDHHAKLKCCDSESNLRIKFSLLAMGLLGLASISRADSLNTQLHDVASYLASNSVLPITQQADMQLSRNILIAQADPTCSYCGTLSLSLSEDSVLRAISLYVWDGGPTLISSESLEPVVWIQSRIAINPNLTVTLTPASLDFGNVPVATPEPAGWILLLTGLGACAIRNRAPQATEADS
jgi:hypothetical protein